jgi:rfaE bifunctional protein nucleotidyltransferase chain/domain
MRPFDSKILTRDEAAERCRVWREEGLVVGFSSGAFDIMHVGHAEFLERARGMCDRLVVAVNSDASIRSYKGPKRPILSEAWRARLVAALESVDLVFLFDERRNAANIEAICPHLYMKAGDYAKSGLTSAEVVERLGGKAVLIDIQTPVSTTDILRKVANFAQVDDPHMGADGKSVRADDDSVHAVELPAPSRKSAPAVFLDRDGTINRDVGYLHTAEDFELLPNAGEGMRRLMDMGYRLVVVTNQGGIGLGYYTRYDFYKVNNAMFKRLKPFGVVVDGIYYCPHGMADRCDCRKPGGALFQRAAKDLNVDLARSVFIGDRTTDIEAARRLGIRSILVRTGAGGRDGEYAVKPDYVADDLRDAADWLLAGERGAGPNC